MRKLLNIALGLILSLTAVAQQNDAQLWLGAAIETEIVDNLSLDFEQEVRMFDNASRFKSTFSQVGLEYKVNKYFRFGGNYRLIVTSDDIRHRPTAYLRANYKVSDLTMIYTFKFQTQFEKNESIDQDLRNKLALRYKATKKIAPYVSGELFYNYNYKFSDFNKYRLTGGVKWEFVKDHSVKPYVSYQKEFNVEYPVTSIIFGLGYKFSL